MKTQAYLMLLFFISMCLQACAQTKEWVVKSNGFYTIPIPGTIPVDDNGQPIDLKRDTIYMLFVETKEKEIQWEGAWKSSQSFSVIPSIITNAKAIVGESRVSNQKIELAPASGNTLWQIELAENPTMKKAPYSIAPSEILLKGQKNKKPFYIKVKALTELASPLYQ